MDNLKNKQMEELNHFLISLALLWHNTQKMLLEIKGKLSLWKDLSLLQMYS